MANLRQNCICQLSDNMLFEVFRACIRDDGWNGGPCMPCINDALALLASCSRLAGEKNNVYKFWRAKTQVFIESWNTTRSMKQTYNVFHVWYMLAHLDHGPGLHFFPADENEDAQRRFIQLWHAIN